MQTSTLHLSTKIAHGAMTREKKGHFHVKSQNLVGTHPLGILFKCNRPCMLI